MAKTVKAVQLSLLLLLAIGAVAAAPASAASPEWWVEGSEIAKAETLAETVMATKGATFKIGSTATVTCSTVKIKKGVIEPRNSNSSAFAFESCSIVGQSGCEVPNFNSEPLVFPLEGTTGALQLNFHPASGSVLAVVVVNNKGGCTVAGTYTLTGGAKIGMRCDYPDVETEKTEHKLVFGPETGSEVFWGKTKVVFEGVFIVKLASGNKWSAK